MADERFEADDGVQLEDYLELRHLEQLKQAFQEHDQAQGDASKGMGPEEFADVVADVLGTRHFDHQLENLFTKLDMSGDGYVDWNDFCTYILLQLREKDFIQTRSYTRFDPEQKIRHIVHNRQETTSKVLAIDSPLRFITLSKEGIICQWDKALHLTKHIPLVAPDENSRSVRPRFKMWATDSVYMANCRKLVVASTGRDLRFFDVTSTNYTEEFYLYGLPDVPLSLHYWYNKTEPSAPSLLIFGDDDGSIQVFKFLKPTVQLFAAERKRQECAQIFMQEISQGKHAQTVEHMSIEHVHPEAVTRVRYMPENSSIVSSCLNPSNSLVIMDTMRKRKSYTFNLSKGVQCFDLSKALNVLVTGSLDHRVRVWNPYVPAKPTAVLDGHTMGIVDVILHERMGLIISLAKDNVLKLWDLKEQVCIQSVIVKFPSSVLGKLPEHGSFALYLQLGVVTRLVVASNDYLALLKLASSGVTNHDQPYTHLDQLCCAIYNPHFKQVVTAADDSTVAHWDIGTGRKSLLLSSVHGQEEITCMVLDDTWRRLVTAAQNGTIKVWNVQNGHCLHQLEATDDAEVTGLIALSDKKMVISVGWNRKIVTYDISHPENQVVVGNTVWQGGQVHQDDILSASLLPPSTMATGSFDGAIYVWTLETQKVYVCLRRAPRLFITKPHDEQGSNSRSNSQRSASFKVAYTQPPVDKLMFLLHRGQVRSNPAAILLSSEGGTIRWWSLAGPDHLKGEFYAPDGKEESILAMASDPKNKLLLTGDTKGLMAVWDIGQYCTDPNKTYFEQRPRRITAWSAHETAVVSVEYVCHDCGDFIITASTDQTCRLWTVQGYCVGLFGQRQPWNLRQPSTWEDQPPEGQSITEAIVEEQHLRKNSDTPRSDFTLDEVSTTGTSAPLDNQPLTSHPDVSLQSSDNVDVGAIRQKPLDAIKREKSYIAKDNEPTTISPEVVYAKQHGKTFLGWKVEQHLMQRQKDRIDRRRGYGDINIEHTTRMGLQCTPYRALATLNVDNLSLSDDPSVHRHRKSSSFDSHSLLSTPLLPKPRELGITLLPVQTQNKNDKLPKLHRTGTKNSIASTSNFSSVSPSSKTIEKSQSSLTTPSQFG